MSSLTDSSSVDSLCTEAISKPVYLGHKREMNIYFLSMVLVCLVILKLWATAHVTHVKIHHSSC